jgi:hypothetical protein
MEVPLQAVVPVKYDSALLIWPDNRYQKIILTEDSVKLNFTYQAKLPVFDYTLLQNKHAANSFSFEDITKQYGISYLHKENLFVEFDREPLMPFMASQEGPALAVADINGDKLDDFFIGSVKWEKSAVFIQHPGGKFIRTAQPALDADSTWEDVDACWADFTGDGFIDLAVASGGNEYYGKSEFLLPRLYINDGKGNLTKKAGAFSNIFITASCVFSYDFNNDGRKDIFLGGRAVPFQYGAIPRSYILQNDGAGIFTDVTKQYSADLELPGFVKDATLTDLEGDGDKDLLLALEWDAVTAFINNRGRFEKKSISDKKGWWNFVLPLDADGDGDTDFIAGNQGLNSRFAASDEEPVRFYYFDADNNGKKEQIITYYLQGKELPFANKAELEKQIPSLKKKFLYAEDFAKASLKDIFGTDKLRKAEKHEVNYFSSALFINNGNLSFTVQALPWQAQITSYWDAEIIFADNDSLPDVLLTGNFYPNNIQMGRYDADYGSILLNKGNGLFAYSLLKGLSIKGEARKVKPVTLPGAAQSFLIARNNDSLLLIRRK